MNIEGSTCVFFIGRPEDPRCGKPTVGYTITGCKHEHIRRSEFCQRHLDVVKGWYEGQGYLVVCIICRDMEGSLEHECPIQLIEASWQGIRTLQD